MFGHKVDKECMSHISIICHGKRVEETPMVKSFDNYEEGVKAQCTTEKIVHNKHLKQITTLHQQFNTVQ